MLRLCRRLPPGRKDLPGHFLHLPCLFKRNLVPQRILGGLKNLKCPLRGQTQERRERKTKQNTGRGRGLQGASEVRSKRTQRTPFRDSGREEEGTEEVPWGPVQRTLQGTGWPHAVPPWTPTAG